MIGNSGQNIISIIWKRLINKSSEIDNGTITFLNPSSYLIARKYPHVFDGVDHIGIDGIMLAKLLSSTMGPVNRLSFDFTSLADEVFNNALENHQSIYVIGSKPLEVASAVKKIRSFYCGIRIIGFRDGYFSDDTEKLKCIGEIIEKVPDIVIVGMGGYHQECFLLDLKNNGWKGLGITCGGFLHQTAMSKKLAYYPAWINKFHLRWLYRIVREPKLLKRYTLGYAHFLLVFTCDIVTLKFTKKN